MACVEEDGEIPEENEGLDRLEERRGRLYRYPVIYRGDRWHLQWSFHSYQRLKTWEGPEELEEGRLYDVSWIGGRESQIKLVPCDEEPGTTYTYATGIEELGTDDELKVYCRTVKGFGWSPWVGLRGITLGEGGPTYGPAIQFVENLIADPDEHFVVTMSYVEVTGRKDMDRDLLLGDFYHLKGDVSNEEVAARGTFLNRELVERGLARVLG